MLYDLIALILITSSTWVYLDASGKGIGKHSDQKGFFNMSAGAWGASVLLFWLLAFPADLVERSDLIAEAQKHPVQVKRRALKAVILAVSGLLLMMLLVL